MPSVPSTPNVTRALWHHGLERWSCTFGIEGPFGIITFVIERPKLRIGVSSHTKVGILLVLYRGTVGYTSILLVPVVVLGPVMLVFREFSP
jgi:hypothetical protein